MDGEGAVVGNPVGSDENNVLGSGEKGLDSDLAHEATLTVAMKRMIAKQSEAPANWCVCAAFHAGP